MTAPRNFKDVVGKHRNAPVLRVNHSQLRPLAKQSFSTWCPLCTAGLLMGRREVSSLQLEAEDYCRLCGQRVVYTDIETVRAQDWMRPLLQQRRGASCPA